MVSEKTTNLPLTCERVWPNAPCRGRLCFEGVERSRAPLEVYVLGHYHHSTKRSSKDKWQQVRKVRTPHNSPPANQDTKKMYDLQFYWPRLWSKISIPNDWKDWKSLRRAVILCRFSPQPGRCRLHPFYMADICGWW